MSLVSMLGRVVSLSPERLAPAVLVEQHDERQVSDRRYLSECSMAMLTATPETVVTDQLIAAS